MELKPETGQWADSAITGVPNDSRQSDPRRHTEKSGTNQRTIAGSEPETRDLKLESVYHTGPKPQAMLRFSSHTSQNICTQN
jgi:hypothetical protein